MQLELLDRVPLRDAKQEGVEAAEAFLAKAEDVAGFDADGAGKFIVGWLRRYGPTSGESLVRAAKEHGYRPHDGRAFGPVFRRLVNASQIKCLRADLPRENGHNCSGGRLWGIA